MARSAYISSRTSAAERIKKRLEKEIKTFPTHFNLDKGILDLDNRYFKKNIRMLESRKQHEHEIWQIGGVREENLLSFLYFKEDGQYKAANCKKAIQASQGVLEIDSSNLIATSNLAMFHLKQNKIEDAKNCLARLKEWHRDTNLYEKLYLFSMAEIAYAYGLFGRHYYSKAIQYFEQVLDVIEEKPLDVSSQTILLWKFCLAQKYNQMLNTGNLYILSRADEYFQKIRNSLVDVIDNHESKTLIARSWCELGSAYEKYKIIVLKASQTEMLPNNLTSDQCMEKGRQVDDPYVLERWGRYCRQHASKKEDLKDAELILQSALEVSPVRHVACHQLGLVYRSMWHVEANLEPKELHVKDGNSIGKPRKGRHQCRSKRNKACTPESEFAHRLDHCGYESSAACSPCTDPHIEIANMAKSTGFSYPMQHKGFAPHCSSINIKQSVPLSHVKQNGFPREQMDYEKISRHRRPRRFDTLQAQNPRVTNDSSETTKILRKAMDCFQRASEIVFHTSVQYLVEIARCYISLGENDKAEELFERAENNTAKCDMKDASKCDLKDASLLYEQWALLKHYLYDEGNQSINIKDVQHLYKLSVENSTQSGNRSRIAYNKLDTLLDTQRKEHAGDMELAYEHAYVNIMVGEHNRAKPAQKALKEFVRTHQGDEKKYFLQKLIEIYAKQGKYSNAYRYILQLMDTKPNKEQLDMDPEFILQIALEAAYEASKVDITMGQKAYKEIFHDLIEYFNGCRNTASIKPYSDIVLLASNSTALIYIRMRELLEETLGLCVFSGAVDCPDITPGMGLLGGYEKPLLQSPVVLVFSEKYSEDYHLRKLVDECLIEPESNRRSRICCVVNETEPPFPLQSLPRIHLSDYLKVYVGDKADDDIKKTLIFDFFTKVLL